jgi:hypothetical protein
MIMVVFGAGASYDSDPSHPAPRGHVDHSSEFRMPLANQLFADRRLFNLRLSSFPECFPIVPYLRSGERIEEKLQELLDEASNDPVRNQQLAAVRYYLQSMIRECQTEWLMQSHSITNQCTLLDQLRPLAGEGICLVTFNYDTLIEHALQSVGVATDSLPDYISDVRYKLIKLHGSVNWAHVLKTRLTTPDLMLWVASTR